MVTTFYFRRITATGVVPNAKQSGDTISRDVATSYATYAAPCDMLTTAGSVSEQQENSSTVNEPGVDPHYTHYGTFITPPLEAQTVSGTITFGACMAEGAVAVNGFPRIHIYKWLANDTKGSDLLGPYTTTESEMPGSYGGSTRIYALNVAFTSTTFAAGDRIVIEVESEDQNTKTTAYLHSLRFGGEAGTTGYPYHSYLEFSGTVNIQTGPATYTTGLNEPAAYKVRSTAAAKSEAAAYRVRATPAATSLAGAYRVRSSATPLSLGAAYAVEADFAHVKEHIITGSTDGAKSNYVMQFVVVKGTGADSGNTVNLNPAYVQHWPYDIAFYRGDTLLRFWRESDDGTTAIYQVEIDSLAASPTETTIKVKYGKDSTTDNSTSAIATFFDHFEGTSLDTTNKWQFLSTAAGREYTVSGSVLSIRPTSTTYTYPISKSTFGNNMRIRAKVKSTHVNPTYGYYAERPLAQISLDGTVQAQLVAADASSSSAHNHLAYNVNGTGTYSSWLVSDNMSAATWTVIEINRIGKFVVKFNDGTGRECTTNYDTDSLPAGFGARNGSQTGSGVDADWIFVTPSTPNEPTHGSWTAVGEPTPHLLSLAATYGVLPTVKTTSLNATYAVSGQAAKRLGTYRYTGNGITVGIIDSGIDLTHPDLEHVELVAWHDYVESQSEPYDDIGHGTAVAGLLCGHSTTDGGQFQGIAPGVKLVVCRCLVDGYTSDYQFDPATVISAISFCIDNGCKVISMSMGNVTHNAELDAAITDAVDNHGIIFVESAGNAGPNASTVKCPAHSADVLAVGALQSSDVIQSYSSRGPGQDSIIKPDLCARDEHPAPKAAGTQIASSYDTYYVNFSGTSSSTPQVAGACAILFEANSALTNAQIIQILKDTATDLGTAGADNTYGYGKLNITAAISRARTFTTTLNEPAAYKVQTVRPFMSEAAAYKVKTSTRADKAAAYRVRGKQLVSLSAAYEVYVQGIVTSYADITAEYKVRSSSQKNEPAAYRVRSVGPLKSEPAAYKVLSSAPYKSEPAAYRVRSYRTPTSLTAAYRVYRSHAALSEPARYCIITKPAASELSAAYRVRTVRPFMSEPAAYKVTSHTTLNKAAEYVVYVQGLQTTRVNFPAAYRVRAKQRIDKTAAYRVHNAQYMDVPAAYRIRSTASVKSETAAYRTLSSHQNTKTATYCIPTFHRTDLAASYRVKTSTRADKTATYRVRGKQLISKSAAYAVYVQGVSTTRLEEPAAYVVRSTHSALSEPAAYRTRSSHQISLSAAYEVHVQSTISNRKDLAAAYVVRAKERVDLPAAYRVKATPTAASKSAAFRTQSSHQLNKSAAFKTNGQHQISKSAAYSTYGKSQISLGAEYFIKVPGVVLLNLPAAYMVRSRAGYKSESAAYKVQTTHAAISLTAEYDVAGLGHIELSASYAVYSASKTSLPAAYKVLTTRPYKSLAAAYKVKSSTLKSLTAAYKTSASQRKEHTAAYRVLSVRPYKSVTAAYMVMTTKLATSLTAAYMVQSGHAISKTAAYAIYNPNTAFMTVPGKSLISGTVASTSLVSGTVKGQSLISGTVKGNSVI